MIEKFKFYEVDDENTINININPKLYNLETVYFAAYHTIDHAYLFFEGDPDLEIKVKIFPKENNKIDFIAKEFFNNLLIYQANKIGLKNKEIIRTVLLQNSFATESVIDDDTIIEKNEQPVQNEPKDIAEELLNDIENLD